MCIAYHLGALCGVRINVVAPALRLLKGEALLEVMYIY